MFNKITLQLDTWPPLLSVIFIKAKMTVSGVMAYRMSPLSQKPKLISKAMLYRNASVQRRTEALAAVVAFMWVFMWSHRVGSV